MLCEASAQGEASGYLAFVAEDGQAPLAYICFGPTPLTIGTWDIYWIAVDPHHQRRGLGAMLTSLAEEEVRRRQGRLILVETSSQELYTPTRAFYDRIGYQEIGRIPDFYDVGDSKVTYSKTVAKGAPA